MSILYAESNDEDARSLFEKKLAYRYYVISQEHPHIVNFNFGEKYFYGRTNRTFIPIIFNNGPRGALKLKLFNERFLQQPDSRPSAVNFVVDAFNDMAQQFRKCEQMGKLRSGDPFLTNLKIFKAYQEPKSMYAQHHRAYSSAIAERFSALKIKVRNFNEFATELMVLMKKSASRIAFTKTGYIKSRYCPIACSGLALEIADLDVTNDQAKITEFVESPNWEFYVNACNNHGFMIDESVPWRIVADIDSKGMQAYAAKYDVNGTDEILNLGYSTVHGNYYTNRFKYDLYNLYNAVKKKQFRETTICGNNTPVSKTVYPRRYSFDELMSLYPEQYFLDLYFKIRTMEEETPPLDAELQRLYNDCQEIHTNTNVFRAIEIFEQILNKPFDNRGSLSYINEYLQANRP